MIRTLFILIFISLAKLLWSQEKVVPDSISNHNTKLVFPEVLIGEPLFSDSPISFARESYLDFSFFKQPLLPDYNKLLGIRKTLSFQSVSSNQSFRIDYGLMPFTTNGTIFNQTAYRISDRVLFGGNSFGVQSVFDRPNLNPAIQNMSTKGASMYMQYKVSKNFKIETRVSISNHGSPWEP